MTQAPELPPKHGWLLDQLAMGLLTGTLMLCAVLLEMLRLLLFPLSAVCQPAAPAESDLTCLIDGDCIVCNLLARFIQYRAQRCSGSRIGFISFQRVLAVPAAASDDPPMHSGSDKVDGSARAAARWVGQLGGDLSQLGRRLHVVENARNDDAKLHIGTDAVLHLLRRCHHPYPAAAQIGLTLPAAVKAAAYDCFSRNRHAWFGRVGSSEPSASASLASANEAPSVVVASWQRCLRCYRSMSQFFSAVVVGAPPPQAADGTLIDGAAQRQQALIEAALLSGTLVVSMTTMVLPFGNGHKSGYAQDATRYLVLLTICLSTAAVSTTVSAAVAFPSCFDATRATTTTHATAIATLTSSADEAPEPLALPSSESEGRRPPRSAWRRLTLKRLATRAYNLAAALASTVDTLTVPFYRSYVGPAAPRTSSLIRMSAALVLLMFTADFNSPPLGRFAELPPNTCRPVGMMRLLQPLLPMLDSFFLSPQLSPEQGRAAQLDGLERWTRAVLFCALLGAGSRVSVPLGCLLFWLYGGVVISCGRWRGHSYIAAAYCLLLTWWCGAAADDCSVDAFCHRLYLRLCARFCTRGNRCAADTSPSTTERYRARNVRRGWLRFQCVTVVAATYTMAGLSKLCAVGVGWASGTNLKAKLFAATLDQKFAHIGLSLALRNSPYPVWLALGVMGMFGELAMALLPCGPPWAKLGLPAMMWGMHLGIALLMHIHFVDLLLLLPAYYVWMLPRLDEGAALGKGHLAPGELSSLTWPSGDATRASRLRPWDLRDLFRRALDNSGLDRCFRQGGVEAEATPEAEAPLPHEPASSNDNADVARTGVVTADDAASPHGVAAAEEVEMRAGAWPLLLLLLIFLLSWVSGKDRYPLNGFRMFAHRDDAPVTYERFVAYDARMGRMRNWHPQELSPAMSRRTLRLGFEACANAKGAVVGDPPLVLIWNQSSHAHPEKHLACDAFMAFLRPAVARLAGSPTYLQYQRRTWDFTANLEVPFFCDTMYTLTYNVPAENVTARIGVPCNGTEAAADANDSGSALDWRTCDKTSWFFWESSCVFNIMNT